MGEELVVAALELSREEAYALAQLAKRTGFSDVRELAVDEGEAYAMIYALSKLRDALAASGVCVR
jgi:hypothetical protein